MKSIAAITLLLQAIIPASLASIHLGPQSPEWLLLAAQDLAADARRTTGQDLPVGRQPIHGLDTPSVLVGALEDPAFATWIRRQYPDIAAALAHQPEAFEIFPHTETGTLVMAGSDYRGAMRAIYVFSKQALGIDPTYLWTGIEPKPLPSFDWLAHRLSAPSPSFRYRGWFINDEDLLQGWIESGGPRHIDYPHYAYAVDPKAMAQVCETAVRLGYNLIIPASFLDISNPPERALLDEAAKRGLYLSMHHIEPLGVSAFTFFNFWKKRGQEPLFSYYSSPAQMEETWRHYAQLWAEYPNVIWQLGLRGIADRPMWMADPNTPESDAERGAIMSEAIALQRQIVQQYAQTPDPITTTTLWAEGSLLFRQGHLQIPQDTMIIFADNSPGRVWQADFHEMPRDPKRNYGVYFHHQLWGSGPHMVQGVSPAEQAHLFREAYQRQSHHYAILNASSIREFVLGLTASAQTLASVEAFDSHRFLQDQCAFWFGPAAEPAARAYQSFFESYLENPRGIPYFLDGLTRQRGLSSLQTIQRILDNRPPEGSHANPSHSWGARHLADMRPHLPPHGDATSLLELQLDHLDVSKQRIESARAAIAQHGDPSRQRFFDENLRSQWLILHGLVSWALELEKAVAALKQDDRPAARQHLSQSLQAWQSIEEGQALVTRNPRWQHWYRGDTKMSLPSAHQKTQATLTNLAPE